MTRSAFAQSLSRSEPAKAPSASYCRAGMPAPGDNRSLNLCHQRQQCEQHKRYVKLVESGEPPGHKARVMVLPFVPGCQCHFFERGGA